MTKKSYFLTSLALIMALGLLTAAFAVLYTNAEEPSITKRMTLSALEAHQKSARGEIYLIDIRRPLEWQDTGVPEHAHTISMHETGFEEKLNTLIKTSGPKPLALICARGGRSHFQQQALSDKGFGTIIDMSEGMLGSNAGEGWIAQGLPVKAYP